MKRMPGLVIIAVFMILLLNDWRIAAQDDVSCRVNLQSFYSLAYDQCHTGPTGYVCNGGLPPGAEPQGPVSNSLAPLGAMVDYTLIDAVHSPPILSNGSIGGLVWLRASEAGYSAMLVGDVRLRDVSEGLPWLALNVQTDATEPACVDAPYSALVIQSMLGNAPSYLTVNGASLVVSGSVAVYTQGAATHFVVVEGEARVQSGDTVQAMVAGQQTTIIYTDETYSQPQTTPALPIPFDDSPVRNIPTQLLDRQIQLPQPGYATTEGIVNLRAAPSLDAERLLQVPPGQIMSVLGRNPAGDWYHVRLLSGETGWMYADLLRHDHGPVTVVYASTPGPPPASGGAMTGRVIAVNGIAMREQPFPNYTPIYQIPNGHQVNLVSRSPYGAWVKVEATANTGWIPLVALDTQAAIAVLPLDQNVIRPEPTPPPPVYATAEPGSWGNAFPDPDCVENCGNG